MTRDDDLVRDRTVVHDERSVGYGRGYGRNTIRALFTLLGVGAAGFLIWLAHYFELDSTGEFWAAMGLVAGAGLALVLSQLFGGWTKWGWPKISLAVLLLGWLPAGIATGWILLTLQPDGGWQQGRLEGWSDDIGILGFVQDFAPFLPAVALAFGAVTGFIFDTTGPRRERLEREPVVLDEDVHDYDRTRDDVVTTTPTARRGVVTEPGPTTPTDDRVEIHDPDRTTRR